jgi:hypothetical protein
MVAAELHGRNRVDIRFRSGIEWCWPTAARPTIVHQSRPTTFIGRIDGLLGPGLAEVASDSDQTGHDVDVAGCCFGVRAGPVCFVRQGLRDCPLYTRQADVQSPAEEVGASARHRSTYSCVVTTQHNRRQGSRAPRPRALWARFRRGWSSRQCCRGWPWSTGKSCAPYRSGPAPARARRPAH